MPWLLVKFKNEIPSSGIVIIPNIFGGISPYGHQPTRIWNTAQLSAIFYGRMCMAGRREVGRWIGPAVGHVFAPLGQAVFDELISKIR